MGTPSSGPLVLGIDAGTRMLRAGLFTTAGERISSGTSRYDFQIPRPGWAEQDPQTVWGALVAAVRACLAQAGQGAADKVVGLSVVGTAVTLILSDSDGSPLLPALLWMDTRATSEAAEISALESEWLRYTGGQVSPEWGLPKALWLKRHQQDLYSRAAKAVELVDWLGFQLTGRWTASLTTTSAEWSYASHLGGWPKPMLESIGLGDLIERFPGEILPPGARIGPLSKKAAEQLGLTSGISVAQGMMDSYAAALGLDVFAQGRVILSLGTSSAYLTILDAPLFHPGLLGPVPDAFGPGKWAMQGGQTSAGAIPDWFRRTLGQGSEPAQLDAEAAHLSPGAEGLIALDCWQGSRSPHRDPLARGAWWGLNLGHDRTHLYRALLESVAYGGRQIVEAFQSLGVAVSELWVTGGGTRSPLWIQIHADVMGLPLIVAPDPEMTSAGAAVCASVGGGLHPTLAEASRAMAPEGRQVEPDPERHLQFAPYYEQYLIGYDALRESLHKLAQLQTARQLKAAERENP